jgi:hypothetical protein
MLCLSYYCLCLLFNKIDKKADHVLPGRERAEGEKEGAGGRNEPKNVKN